MLTTYRAPSAILQGRHVSGCEDQGMMKTQHSLGRGGRLSDPRVALAVGLHPRLQNMAVGLCAPCFCFQIFLDLSSLLYLLSSCLLVHLSLSVSLSISFFPLLLSLGTLPWSTSSFHSRELCLGL